MAPKTRAKCAKAAAKDPITKRSPIRPEFFIMTREEDSKNTERCGAFVRSEDTKTALQDTAKAAANVSAELVDSIQPDELRESAGVPSPTVLPEWNGRRRRSGLPAEDDDQKVSDFHRTIWAGSKWASMSVDELVAATTLVQMKNDPNYNSAPVEDSKEPRPTHGGI